VHAGELLTPWDPHLLLEFSQMSAADFCTEGEETKMQAQSGGNI